MRTRLVGPSLPLIALYYLAVFLSVLRRKISPSIASRKNSNYTLKSDELHFWLKCGGDPAKGLKTKRHNWRKGKYLSVVCRKLKRDSYIVDRDQRMLELFFSMKR